MAMCDLSTRHFNTTRLLCFALGLLPGLVMAQPATTFQADVLPLLQQHCVSCHNVDQTTAGVRVDQFTEESVAQEERFLRLWQNIAHQLHGRTMPPKEEPQPSDAQRAATLKWIEQLVQVARSRPTPKNGLVRRLTIAQYRNTLRDLLGLDENLTESLPPDAVSRDGFVNNKETLQLSPLLLEAYFQIAGQALDRTLVDLTSPPRIQNFVVEMGRKINAEPCRDELILGANNHLLRNEDFVVRELSPDNPLFRAAPMETKFRFIEGYAGNDTVRGWREYDSLYHAVFACMRGSEGYLKGNAYDVVPTGLLLRPAIPSIEEFQVESTYGPKANFKISLRKLPEGGRFRVTVKAAKYDDGLLLDKHDPLSAHHQPDVVSHNAEQSDEINVPQSGIYRVDVIRRSLERDELAVDDSRLVDQLAGHWSLDGNADCRNDSGLHGKPMGDPKWIESPFGQAIQLDGQEDALIMARTPALDVGTGDFTVSAWIRPSQLRQGGIACLGKYSWTHGWYLDMPDNHGTLRIETAGPESTSNGTVSSAPGTIAVNKWQHVTAVVRRGENSTRLYVNGYAVAKGSIGPANLDNPKVNLHIGRIQDAQEFHGAIDDVRIYRRALDEAEVAALVAPGQGFAHRPKMPPQELRLQLGGREFSNKLSDSPFVAVRLPTGPLPLAATYAGADKIERVELRALPEGDQLARKFVEFEQRRPNLGVHLGLRRDCGSTLSRVGKIQQVDAGEPREYIFEGAIDDFPSPDVEKDNVNYLAGLREIGVRSEYTDGRDMPRLLIESVQFEGPLVESWPPRTHTNILPPQLTAEDVNAYSRRVLANFATRAYRRPVNADELAVLLRVSSTSREAGHTLPQSLKDAMQVALTSPQFLFVTETSRGPEPEPLDDFELASKLAYFLWNSPPDEQMLNLARSGRLRSELDTEITRLLSDPKSYDFVSQFAAQWLALDKFQVLEPDRQQFPKLTREVREQLADEPIRFVDHLIKANLSVRHLVQSDVVLVNEIVADYYGLGARVAGGFEFQALKHGRADLGGLLSQAAILSGLSDGRQANPIKRGAWLARRIIAEPPDDPPPNVPNLKQETEHLPLRERLAQHRNQPGCAQCHAKIDPYGIPLEEYDAGGRHKADPGDVRSTLPDAAQVNGASDLKQYLGHDRLDQLAFGFLKHLTIYACGRDLSYYELELLRQRSSQWKADGYRLQDAVRWVVHSELFLEK